MNTTPPGMAAALAVAEGDRDLSPHADYVTNERDRDGLSLLNRMNRRYQQ